MRAPFPKLEPEPRARSHNALRGNVPRGTRWLLGLTLLFGSARARGDEPEFGLAEALRAMRAEHPALTAAALAVEAAKADVRDAALWNNPMASIAYTPGVRASSYDRAGYLNYGLTQFMELSNVPGARKRSAQRLVAASAADQRALLVQMSLDVEEALIDLVTAEHKEALIKRALELLNGAAGVVEKRFQAGASPRYDTTRIGVTIATAHADHDTALADEAHAWAELAAAVGPGMRRLQGTPAYPLETALSLPDASALLALAERERPDLEAARQRKAAADAQVSAAKRAGRLRRCATPDRRGSRAQCQPTRDRSRPGLGARRREPCAPGGSHPRRPARARRAAHHGQAARGGGAPARARGLHRARQRRQRRDAAGGAGRLCGGPLQRARAGRRLQRLARVAAARAGSGGRGAPCGG